ncbi:ClbS/DfsB family four-helix bundle protein [Candidatus Galacturonibacter soehngenii]|uniref:ClbS/DfsB family four-helix bundle protein n=1 Tax=Candidatus Galacturonatibacter soehngenii TaxID=2307010 RepID=A0A7V7UCY0_9FIRM|nr:ClbS/DfsB family four-helix bundle protein [Candidatus Galacturonibacter soehngenii]KAB1439731.1 ClbS/DfsB family four-helix bundle protein [Candidatus Galacturonibacter soehngenii]
MGRPTSKPDLITAAEANYEEMKAIIASLTEKELLTPFEFDANKKEAHWQRDKNLRDVLVHLYEWHQLLLDWISSNMKGENKAFLPETYNWKNYGKMNEFFWKKHQNTTLEDAKEMLDKSHREVMKLAETFTNEELFSKGVYQWADNNTLGTFFVSNTASHYNWAIKKLKAHKRRCKLIVYPN